MDSILADLRYGLRLLLRAPAFTAVTILTLALGIGANTAIFSTVDAVLLRALPYGDPSRIVMVWEDASFAGFPRNTPAPGNVTEWKARNRVFVDMAATRGASANLTVDGPPELVLGRGVTANFFSVLQVRPSLGRVFTDDEDRHDLDAIAAEVTVATRLVLICNPNNPTSTAVTLEEVEALLRRVPSHVCVILDEAYCEFALTLGDTYASLELLRRYPNLVLLRTFSKVYGLAALRVGYALCGSEDFRVAVDQVRQPFYLNAAAQAAAVEALRYQDEVERRVTETIGGRLELSDGARGLGLWVAESDANFIWLHLPEGIEEADMVSGLRDRGVLVRAGSSLGRTGSLRVTVGTPAENARFTEALALVT